jgi:signal peptidase II
MKIKMAMDRKGGILSLSVIIATVVIDFVTKVLVMNNMQLYDSIPLIKNVLHLTYITNDGAAFGSFSEHRWVFMTMSTVMILFMAVLLFLWTDKDPLFYTSVSMVLGGGVGNMIDRIAYGTVVDFIDFRAFPELWKWIFNGADSFVCIGVGLFVLYYIRAEIKESRRKKAEEAKEEETENVISDEE